MAQPVAHFVGVFVLDNGLDGIAFFHRAVAVEDGQQVQVVVTEDNLHAVFVLHAEFEALQRFGPAVDDVAREPERVAAVVESDFGQQGFQFVEAALHVADCVMCHDVYILDLRCIWYAGGQTASKRRKRRAVFSCPACFSDGLHTLVLLCFRPPAYSSSVQACLKAV